MKNIPAFDETVLNGTGRGLQNGRDRAIHYSCYDFVITVLQSSGSGFGGRSYDIFVIPGVPALGGKDHKALRKGNRGRVPPRHPNEEVVKNSAAKFSQNFPS